MSDARSAAAETSGGARDATANARWGGFRSNARALTNRRRLGEGRADATGETTEKTSPSGDANADSRAKTSKEDLGRATWTFLHTFAAQFPDEPTKRQERDARELIMILTRMYPCGECARHFAEIVKNNPPDCSSGLGLQRWMCAAHNEVNESLGKPRFDCSRIDERWNTLDCEDDDGGGASGCTLEGRKKKVMSMR